MSPLQLYPGAAVAKPSQRVIFAHVEVSHSNTTESPSSVIAVSTPVSHIFNDWQRLQEMSAATTIYLQNRQLQNETRTYVHHKSIT